MKGRAMSERHDGRSAVNCPFPGNEMWHRLRRPSFDDLIVT